jgi:hypothetical protein
MNKQQLRNMIREERKGHLLAIPTLSENIYKPKPQIDEGIWDSIKFGLAKLGSLEASGKLLGKDKIRKAAQDKLDAALEKESNKAVKALIDAIRSEEDTKDFPNMKDQWAFQSALASILVYYDSLKAAVEKYQPGKEEQPEGAMSPEAANAIVEVLHQYLVNTLDNKLADVYKHFKENLEEEGYTLADMLEEQEEGEEEFYDKKSTTMAGLESNFLPIALSLLGGAAYSAGQIVAATAPLAYTKEFITDPGKITQIPGETKKYFDAVIDSRGNGMLKTFSDSASAISGQTVRPMDFAKSVDIIAKQTGNSPEEVITDVMGTLGREKFRGVSGELSSLMYQYAKEGGGVEDVVNATAIKPEFIEFAQNNGASEALMSQIGGAGAGSGAVKDAGMTLLGMQPGGAVMNLAGKVAQGAAKAAIKKGAVTAGAKAAALVPGLGSVLGPMGLAVAGGGLAIKALRMKGKASSRAADLQTARDYIKKFQVDQPVLEPSPTPTPAPEPEGEEGPDAGEEKPVGEKPPEGSEEGPVAGDEEGEEEDIFLALGKLDDDGLKIHRSRARSAAKKASDQDTFQKAQDQAVTGRRTDPNSDDLGRKYGRGLRGPEPETLSHAQMQKKIKGRSKKPGDAFLTVDASIYNDLAAAIRKAGNVRFNATAPNKRDPMKKIIQGLLNQLVDKDKKQTVPQAKRRIATAFKRHQELSDITPDQMDPIVAILQDYGLVRPGGTTTKPSAKKATPKKKPAGKKPAAKKSAPKKKPAAKKAAPKKAAGKKGKAGELKVGADGLEFGTTPPETPGQPKRKAKAPSGQKPGGSQSLRRIREEEQETETLNEVFKRWAVMANIKEKK